jgi:hypothetical protein
VSETTNLQRFQWVDRDTFARDLLQLVYHAPPQLSLKSLQLLSAARSVVAVPKLDQIVLESGHTTWERRYAMRAIANTPGDIYLPHYAQITDAPQKSSPYIRPLFDGLPFDEVRYLAAKHPSNRAWFWSIFESADVKAQYEFLSQSLNFQLPSSFIEEVVQRLLTICNNQPALIETYDVYNCLNRSQHKKTIEDWISQRLEYLVDRCVLQFDSKAAIRIASQHEDFRYVMLSRYRFLESRLLEFEQQLVNQREEQQIRREAVFQSPTYVYLNDLFEKATVGTYPRVDLKPLFQLKRMARSSLAPLSLRAAAIYFSRQVTTHYRKNSSHKPDLMRNFRHFYHLTPDFLESGITLEAGEALREVIDSGSWLEMVDAFLVCRDNTVLNFFEDWIAYQTDRLSGSQEPYTGVRLREQIETRPWFWELEQISMDDLARIRDQLQTSLRGI